MQKYLLAFAVAAFAAGTMMADDVTLSVTAATDIEGTLVPASGNTGEHYQPLNSLKIGEFEFTFAAWENAKDSQLPALYHKNATPTIRLYPGAQMTITFPAAAEVGSITWNMSSVKGVDAAPTVSTGEAQLKLSDKIVVWNNTDKATSVTFTLPTAKGSDGNNPNMQIASFTVSADGAIIEPDPTPDPDPTPSDYIYEGLVSNSDWTYNDVTLPEGLNYVWTWDGSYNCLKASAFLNNTAYAAEAWAVSPVVELPAEASTVNFDHAAKFQTTLRTLCGLYIREEGGEWTALTIPTWPEAGAWTWANSGKIDLAAYAGKKVEFGFKYGSSADGADTWEIKNFRVESTFTGVAVVADENAPVVYYDLNGRCVTEPANGLFIKVQGSKASKVIVK